jgi:hypothetical protein
MAVLIQFTTLFNQFLTPYSISTYSTSYQALKKRQEEVEELRSKQDEERKKREDFDRDGRQQVKFQNLSLVLNRL